MVNRVTILYYSESQTCASQSVTKAYQQFNRDYSHKTSIFLRGKKGRRIALYAHIFPQIKFVLKCSDSITAFACFLSTPNNRVHKAFQCEKQPIFIVNNASNTTGRIGSNRRSDPHDSETSHEQKGSLMKDPEDLFYANNKTHITEDNKVRKLTIDRPKNIQGWHKPGGWLGRACTLKKKLNTVHKRALQR